MQNLVFVLSVIAKLTLTSVAAALRLSASARNTYVSLLHATSMKEAPLHRIQASFEGGNWLSIYTRNRAMRSWEYTALKGSSFEWASSSIAPESKDDYLLFQPWFVLTRTSLVWRHVNLVESVYVLGFGDNLQINPLPVCFNYNRRLQMSPANLPGILSTSRQLLWARSQDPRTPTGFQTPNLPWELHAPISVFANLTGSYTTALESY